MGTDKIWHKVVIWLLFSVLSGFLPFAFLCFPRMADDSVNWPSLVDLWPKGELIIAAAVLAVAGIGDALASIKRFPLIASVAIFCCVFIAFVLGGFFQYAQTLPEAGNHHTVAWNSLWLFLIATFVSTCCKILSEVKP